MKRELYCNNVPTTLSSAVTSSGQTTFNVTSGLDFPKAGNFRILIGTEICIVTSVATSSYVPAAWTVTRGAEGTTATTYTSGTLVNFVVTTSSISNVLREKVITGTSSSYKTALVPARKGDIFIPTDSLYTMVVYDGATWQFLINGKRMTVPNFNGWATDSGPDLNLVTDTSKVYNFMYDPAPAYALHNRYIIAPSRPYTLTMACIPHLTTYSNGVATTFNNVGLGWRSTGGQYVLFGNGLVVGSGGLGYRYYKWNSNSSYNSDYSSNAMPMFFHGPISWMRIGDDGTNRAIYASSNGINWTLIDIRSRTDFSTPDYVVVSVNDSIPTVFLGNNIVHMDFA